MYGVARIQWPPFLRDEAVASNSSGLMPPKATFKRSVIAHKVLHIIMAALESSQKGATVAFSTSPFETPTEKIALATNAPFSICSNLTRWSA